MARLFGAGFIYDAFLLGFRIPNLTRDLFAEGALSSAFVPVFVDLLKKDPKRAWRVASSLFWLMLLGLTALSAFFILIAPWVIGLFGNPGNDASPERMETIAKALSRFAADTAIIDIHNVRVRDTAAGEIVNFHCRAAPSMSVIKVHEHVDEIERALRRAFPTVKRVISHAEPAREP